ncbi:hypothetical protein CBM2617_B120031 [Cupriavidus taiwanensis]|nr:hypothetical protein CBM2617_B120031 [Cupriavidus taiwanensis]
MSRLRAMGAPMLPRPMKAICMGCLLRFRCQYPACFLPSPASGRGAGVRAGVSIGNGFASMTVGIHNPVAGGEVVVLPAPALTPNPSPASGRGEHTSGSRPALGFRRVAYFKLIVVFTPSFTVASSNQRAVTVLVWV